MKSLSVKLGVILIGLAIFGYSEVCKAQCAWVLWEKWEVASIKDRKFTTDLLWTLIVATPQYEQCMENQRRLFEKIKKGANEDKEKYDTISKIEVVPFRLVLTDYKSGGFNSKTLYCLPDTIDPRK
jgi:hypothetical protein